MRLVIGGGTTFKREGNNHTGVKNPYRELSTYRMCWHEAAPSAFTNRDGQQLQAHQGTIVKLNSGNGDDLSKISWIHRIVWIHKVGSAVSPQRPAHLEMNREAHMKQSRQAFRKKKWQAHPRQASERTQGLEMISSLSIQWTTSVHASAPEK